MFTQCKVLPDVRAIVNFLHAYLFPAYSAAMPEEKLLRIFVKISSDVKRRLVHLSVDADAASVEEFAGRMLAKSVDDAWANFDPKRSERQVKPKSK